MIRLLTILLLVSQLTTCKSQVNMNYKQLTPEEQYIIWHKGTEPPFSGKFYDHFEKGIYTCKQCGAALYRSENKFHSGCGWPSFDEEIPGAVKRQPDPDGIRTEIVCANCGGHLGHVFLGEGFTPKNTRHCVNSLSLDFIPAIQEKKLSRAILASGCFWGVEYHFKQAEGVVETTVGYTGGHVPNPTYEQVCTGKTGHVEAIEIIFDPDKTSFEALLKLYFETHDFTQTDGQGPDIGDQYKSVIFYLDNEQKNIAEKLIRYLESKNYKVATQLRKATIFYPAEDYHQDYYFKKGGTPYCHIRRKIF